MRIQEYSTMDNISLYVLALCWQKIHMCDFVRVQSSTPVCLSHAVHLEHTKYTYLVSVDCFIFLKNSVGKATRIHTTLSVRKSLLKSMISSWARNFADLDCRKQTELIIVVNMLDEIFALLLSLFSLLTNETPRVSFRETDNTQEGNIGDDRWLPYINEECGNVHMGQQLNSETLPFAIEDLPFDYNRIRHSPERKSFWKSFRKAVSTSISMAFSLVPPTVLTILFLYFDFNTTNLCREWQHHNNTVPLSVVRIRVIGRIVEVLMINFWFPLTAVILFGWKDFKRRFFLVLYIAFIFAEATVIYYLFLLAFGVYDTHNYYKYPGNALFFTSLICCTIVMLRGSRMSVVSVSYSNLHIMALFSTEFLVCSILSYVYLYAIVPLFISIKEEKRKFMVAALAPGITVITSVICKHIALRRSSEVVHPGRSFVLASFIRGGVIYVYRIMQADFKNIWLFVGLSLFSGVMNFLQKATHQVRMTLWKYIISLLRRTVCCAKLREMPCNTPHYRRLKADLDIQDMLFEYGTLVIGQAYFVLYHTESFEFSMPSFFFEALKRVAIGVGIDFLFNCLSNFVQIHYYNIPIARVWKKYWKRHVLAHLLIVMVTVSYFTKGLLSCFQARESGTNDGQFIVKNCTFFHSDLLGLS